MVTRFIVKIKMFKTAVIFLFIYTSFSDGKRFRSDYKYYPDAEGWLKLHQVPANWREAWLRCRYEGAVLASPLNAKLVSAMRAHMASNNAPPCGMFSGVHATFSRGDYSSVEGVPLSELTINWAPGEPDNYENGESCLIILSNGTMADVKCSDVFPYMCYRKNTAMVITGCGTVDNEYILESRTGSCYKFHRTGQTWSRAYMTCVAEGGYLAIINSEVEALILKDLFAKHKTVFSTFPGAAAIGFHNWGEHGTWFTIHGETLQEAGYDKWSGGQPDNATSPRTGDTGEFCGSMFRNGLLNDIWCNVNVAFICEKSPESINNEDD